MRAYPNNSPQAAARIVAVATLADGHWCKPELDVLDRLRAHAQLGLQPEGFHCVVHAVCEDLLSAAKLTGVNACRIDPGALARLMAEIDDPLLRLTVLRLCVSVVEADGQVADGESVVLLAAIEQWGLQHSPQSHQSRNFPTLTGTDSGSASSSSTIAGARKTRKHGQ